MKIVNIEQGSPEWHKFRFNGIGSSDASVVMGNSPYKTAYQLWEEKSGLVEPDFSDNVAMKKGRDYEPLVRQAINESMGIDFTPICIQSVNNPFALASLDGLSGNKFIEIKLLNEKSFNEIQSTKEIPKHYYDQVQHMYVASDFTLDICHFVVANWSNPSQIIFLDVPEDEDYTQDLLKKERYFWDQVCNFIEPEITDKDVKFLDDGLLDHLARQYLKTKAQSKKLELELETLKTSMLEKVKELGIKRANVNNLLNVSPVYRKGNVQYNKIPELENVDLEKYRGKSTSYFNIKEIKHDKKR